MNIQELTLRTNELNPAVTEAAIKLAEIMAENQVFSTEKDQFPYHLRKEVKNLLATLNENLDRRQSKQMEYLLTQYAKSHTNDKPELITEAAFREQLLGLDPKMAHPGVVDGFLDYAKLMIKYENSNYDTSSFPRHARKEVEQIAKIWQKKIEQAGLDETLSPAMSILTKYVKSQIAHQPLMTEEAFKRDITAILDNPTFIAGISDFAKLMIDNHVTRFDLSAFPKQMQKKAEEQMETWAESAGALAKPTFYEIITMLEKYVSSQLRQPKIAMSETDFRTAAAAFGSDYTNPAVLDGVSQFANFMIKHGLTEMDLSFAPKAIHQEGERLAESWAGLINSKEAQAKFPQFISLLLKYVTSQPEQTTAPSMEATTAEEPTAATPPTFAEPIQKVAAAPKEEPRATTENETTPKTRSEILREKAQTKLESYKTDPEEQARVKARIAASHSRLTDQVQAKLAQHRTEKEALINQSRETQTATTAPTTSTPPTSAEPIQKVAATPMETPPVHIVEQPTPKTRGDLLRERMAQREAERAALLSQPGAKEAMEARIAQRQAEREARMNKPGEREAFEARMAEREARMNTPGAREALEARMAAKAAERELLAEFTSEATHNIVSELDRFISSQARDTEQLGWTAGKATPGDKQEKITLVTQLRDKVASGELRNIDTFRAKVKTLMGRDSIGSGFERTLKAVDSMAEMATKPVPRKSM